MAPQSAHDETHPEQIHLLYPQKRRKEVCIAYNICENALDEATPEDLRQVTAAARERAREFEKQIGSRQSSEIQRRHRETG